MTSLYVSHKPKRQYPSIESVDNEGFDKDDMMIYFKCLRNDPRHSLSVSPEIAAFDKFAPHGLNQIIQNIFNIDTEIENRRDTTEVDKMLKSFRIKINFIESYLDTPKEVDSSGKFIPRNPDDYRISNDFYAANLIVSIKISITAQKAKVIYDTKETVIKGVRISSIPIMVRSNRCNTYKATPEMLKNINEDPTDTGGYFIVNGKEYVITSTENIVFNKPLIFKSTLKTERVYATILSQVGGAYGNSTQLVIHLRQDYGLAMDVQTKNFIKINVPFYLIYRLFGVCVDSDIVKMIVYDIDDNTAQTNRMTEYVIEAFKAKYTVDKKLPQMTMTNNISMFFDLINNQVADPDAWKKDDEAARFVINRMRSDFDHSILPHIGTLPEDRMSKLLHISMLIRDTIMVDIGTRPEDDRDHYANKRAHGAGPSLSKVSKTLINNKIVSPMIAIMRTECLTKSFDAINIVDVGDNIRGQIQGKELENGFIKYINASEKGTRMKEKIRMAAQSLERKNQLNVAIAMRTINASVSKVAKSTKRSDRIRFWHPSSAGLICPAHTPETGEKVGTTKLLAITAIVTDSDDNEDLLKRFVLEDSDVIPIRKINVTDIGRRRLARIYVNGHWIGVCERPYEFVARYRLLRREGQIERFTSIEWNCVDNVIYFYMDLGRLMRPLLIVDNNLEDFNSGKAKKFVQNIRLSHEHIERILKGELTFEHMVKMGFIEYIYAGEEVLLCPSIEQLQKDKHNYAQRWTHCDLEYALYGISAMMGPFIDRNSAFRNVMVTIHSKQACGQPLCNIQTATRRSQRFHMHRVETPIVKTFMRDATPPNGQNAMLLYAVLLGFNQEDSSIVNRGSVERGFLKGVYYKAETVEIEKNQSIRIPKIHETLQTRNQSYAKLGTDGIVPVGTIVEKNDIIVGRVVELAQTTEDGKRYIDKSVQYDNEEPGRVASVITRLDGEDRFIMLTFEYDRPLYNGDKCCLRFDHDVLTERGWIPIADVTMKDKVACLSQGKYLKYEYPLRTIAFEHEGGMYEIETQQISLNVTDNHKMWVAPRQARGGHVTDEHYKAIEAKDVYGKRVRYKRDCINNYPDVDYYKDYSMDSWLKLLGIWIADGHINQKYVAITAKKERKLIFIREVLTELGLEYTEHIKSEWDSQVFRITTKGIEDEFRQLNVGALDKYLPEYVWSLSQRQCRILLDALIEGDGHRTSEGYENYTTSSIRLKEDVIRLCLHCGYCGTPCISKRAGSINRAENNIMGRDIVAAVDCWSIQINKDRENSKKHFHNAPMVNHGGGAKPLVERLYNAKTMVYCLEVPEHIFYVRRRGKACWTQNSSRAGNKTIVGLNLPQTDMPRTKSGLAPDLILNPHSIPTRMTLSQLYEAVTGKLCVKKGQFLDGSVYTKMDVHDMLKEFEETGIGVREEMVNGMTGEVFDTLLFYGPQTAYRLPKFVKEDRHAIGMRGPKNPITGQPLTGKRQAGGQKVGEMEQWVMMAQGSMASFYEEFYLDSDKRTIHICRNCSEIAIYNEHIGRYRCRTCGDQADICNIDSSKTALYFIQQMMMAGIKIKLNPEPRRYESMME